MHVSINGMVKTIPYGFGSFQILHKRKQTQHKGCVCFYFILKGIVSIIRLQSRLHRMHQDLRV